jgi:hypothetical protein
MPGYRRSEKYEPEPEVAKDGKVERVIEKIETRFVMPRMPFGLTAFQVIQILMLTYIILKLNKRV